ncbi:MAG TPA: hypothetical protein ENN19_00340 [Chloroflexi bacterium]|nr:hypothetical protein [Chloroflexota bacterium]
MEEIPTVLITPEAKAALEIEIERAGVGGELTGGLLFGYPPDDQHRLIVDSVRPRPEVGFGGRGFSLEQSRTSQQLAQAREVTPAAHYSGVWYLHRTPNKELSDDEWIQTQAVLEDPDYRFDDLVALVICLYFGELSMHAFYFDKYHSARSQMPEAATLKLTTEAAGQLGQIGAGQSAGSSSPTDWYKAPELTERLKQEYARLSQRYGVEATLQADGQMIFRLEPKGDYGKLVLYLACASGFPDRAPEAFVMAGEKSYPLYSPTLSEWTANMWMADVVASLIEWLNWSLEQFVATAKDAIEAGKYQEAADLLTVVLSIDPRMPKAARLLGQAQAPMRSP